MTSGLIKGYFGKMIDALVCYVLILCWAEIIPVSLNYDDFGGFCCESVSGIQG